MNARLVETTVIGEELNGLGATVKQIIDANLANPAIQRGIAGVSGSLVVRERDSRVAISLLFREGEIAVRNDAVDRPSAYLEAGFQELADISSGQLGPVRAVVTGKVKARGNLWKLLRMSKVLICS